jgi:hypothetical protein
LGLGVAIVVGAVLVSASGAATTRAQHVTRIDVSTRAAVVQYLRSIHVSAKHVVIQRGLRNYAGADCPGRGWTCAGTRYTVVQIAKRGGLNRYACTTAKCAVVQIGSAYRSPVRATPKPPPPPNTALCVKTTGITGSCVINQPSASGTNKAVVWMVTPKLTGLTQSAAYSASITQGPTSISTGGVASNKNLACVRQFVWVDGSTTKMSAANTTVTNDNHELITINQNSLTGTNTVQGAANTGTTQNPIYDCGASGSQLQQDEVLTSVVNSKGGSIIQNQDTLPSTTTCVPASDTTITFTGCANVVTDIEQNKGSGFFGVAGQASFPGNTQNSANFEQSTNQVAIANTPSGTVTQQQDANVPVAPFSGLVGTINQDSAAQSTASVDQEETQCQDAVSVATIPAPTTLTGPGSAVCPVTPEQAPPNGVHLTQTQYGPEGVLTPSASNSGPVHFHTKGYGKSAQTGAGHGMFDTFNLKQNSNQFADGTSGQNQLIQGDCQSSGDGTASGGSCNAGQKATVNGVPVSDGYVAGTIPLLKLACANGNGNNCSATPPPVPVIDTSSEPSNPTDSRSAGPFSWTDVATGGVTYQCALDPTGPTPTFTPCDSGNADAAYSGLTTGSHTFEVEAVDNSNNASAPASFTWTVVDAQISLSPSPATSDAAATSNAVSCTITQNTGSGFVAVPAGTECDWTVTAGPNINQTGSCDTLGTTGTCPVSYSTTGGTGMDTIQATTGPLFSVLGLPLSRTTGDGLHGDGGDATNTWVDAQILLSPLSNTASVGTPMTPPMTCTINQDTGNGSKFQAVPDGTECDWKVTAGPHTGQHGSCTTTGGSCQFSVSDSDIQGGFDTIHATTGSGFSVGGLSLNRSTLTSGTDSSGDSTDASFGWI